MTDQTQELHKSAEDALERGFSIFPCLPHAKEPFTKYAPHGFKSSSRDKTIALQAWLDGNDANYAIDCGASNIAVVDCDHGLKSYEEFLEWQKKSGLPETFTVHTGRRGVDYGVHLYYLGAIPGTDFNLNGVVGEIKSKGGYVVGAGSIHPDSGEKYEIIYDIPMVTLPQSLQVTQKKEFTGEHSGETSVIPQGQRWEFLRSQSGRMRNMGLSEEGIYNGLWDLLKTRCENGESYDDKKIRALANAAFNKFDISENGLVILGQVQPAHLDCPKAKELTTVELQWLWPNHVPLGMVTIFVGHPGMGKGCATIDVVARLTTGAKWPDCDNTNPPANALFIASEDPIDSVQKPRLYVADADLDKVFLFNSVVETSGGERTFLIDRDLPILEQFLTNHNDIKLIVIDPIANHLGGLNMNKEQELRSAFTQLGALAKKWNIAVIVVTHFNKSKEIDSICRVGGAMGIAGAPRVGWAFGVSGRDDGSNEDRVMVGVKTNLCNVGSSAIQYHIEGVKTVLDGINIDAGRIIWETNCNETFDEVMAFKKKSTKKNEAIQWLFQILQDGPKDAGWIEEIGIKQGFSKSTLQRAANTMKLSITKTGLFSGWQWSIPSVENPEEITSPKNSPDAVPL